MNFNHFLTTGSPIPQKLLDAGFTQTADNTFCIDHAVAQKSLTAHVVISLSQIDVTCTDVSTNEPYTLLDVSRARGAFVSSLRNEITNYMEEIHSTCFLGKEILAGYQTYLKEQFDVEADYPWTDGKFDVHDYAVYRCPNNKWFALIMAIPFTRLGLKSDEIIHVVNLKAAPDMAAFLVDNRTIFPAYHMNKKHWITVILSDQIPFEKLRALTEESYDLVK